LILIHDYIGEDNALLRVQSMTVEPRLTTVNWGCMCVVGAINYRQSRPTSTGVRCLASRHCFVRLTADIKLCPRLHFSHNMQQSERLKVHLYPCRVCLQNFTYAHSCIGGRRSSTSLNRRPLRQPRRNSLAWPRQG